MTRREPRALLFDLDDTLVAERSARDEALAEVAAYAAETAGADAERLPSRVLARAKDLWWAHPCHADAYAIGVSSWEALWARFEGDLAWMRAVRDWAPTYRFETWRRALGDVLDTGRDPSDPPRSGLDAHARELALAFPPARRARQRAYPESRPLLERLRSSGRYRVGLLTNGLSCLQREKVERSGLSDLFDVVVAGGDVPSRKPFAPMFERVLEALGAEAHETWMIGNSPDTDIAGARDAGIHAVLVRGEDPRPPHDGGADLVVDRVSDVERALERL